MHLCIIFMIIPIWILINDILKILHTSYCIHFTDKLLYYIIWNMIWKTLLLDGYKISPRPCEVSGIQVKRLFWFLSNDCCLVLRELVCLSGSVSRLRASTWGCAWTASCSAAAASTTVRTTWSASTSRPRARSVRTSSLQHSSKN